MIYRNLHQPKQYLYRSRKSYRSSRKRRYKICDRLPQDSVDPIDGTLYVSFYNEEVFSPVECSYHFDSFYSPFYPDEYNGGLVYDEVSPPLPDVIY